MPLFYLGTSSCVFEKGRRELEDEDSNLQHQYKVGNIKIAITNTANTVGRFSEGVCLATPRSAWCGWDLGNPGPSQPSALPRTLSRARQMTVPTVIGRVQKVKHKNNRKPGQTGTRTHTPCHTRRSLYRATTRADLAQVRSITLCNSRERGTGSLFKTAAQKKTDWYWPNCGREKNRWKGRS